MDSRNWEVWGKGSGGAAAGRTSGEGGMPGGGGGRVGGWGAGVQHKGAGAPSEVRVLSCSGSRPLADVWGANFVALALAVRACVPFARPTVCVLIRPSVLGLDAGVLPASGWSFVRARHPVRASLSWPLRLGGVGAHSGRTRYINRLLNIEYGYTRGISSRMHNSVIVAAQKSRSSGSADAVGAMGGRFESRTPRHFATVAGRAVVHPSRRRTSSFSLFGICLGLREKASGDQRPPPGRWDGPLTRRRGRWGFPC